MAAEGARPGVMAGSVVGAGGAEGELARAQPEIAARSAMTERVGFKKTPLNQSQDVRELAESIAGEAGEVGRGAVIHVEKGGIDAGGLGSLQVI